MLFFFFNDTATTEIYTLSLHDALPIFRRRPHRRLQGALLGVSGFGRSKGDRKSTRLNSSHDQISYAVFCLKKQKERAAGIAPAPSQRNSDSAAVDHLYQQLMHQSFFF